MIQLRDADSSDHQFLKDLHHAAYREVVTRQFGCWNEAEQDVWFEKGLNDADYRIVERDGVPIGAVAVRDGPDHIALVELQLLPEYQSKGIGTQLLLQELGRAARLGLPVRLQVLRDNRARRLYERHNFSSIGETDTHILMIWRLPREDEQERARISAHMPLSESTIGPPEAVEDIAFIDPGQLVDGELELRLVETTPADHARGFAPFYRFAMVNRSSHAVMGRITLRVGHTSNIQLFRGHIGFHVHEAFRGDRLAQRSCRLLTGLARHHSLLPLWLTCNEGNIASQKTIEGLGAEFVEVRHMPPDFPYIAYYGPESRIKRRYRWVPNASLKS